MKSQKSVLSSQKNVYQKDTAITSIDADLQGVQDGRLTEEETMETGSVPLRTYWFYVQSAGGFLVFLLILFMYTLNIGSNSGSSWWLAHWLHVGVAVRNQQNYLIICKYHY